MKTNIYKASVVLSCFSLVAIGLYANIKRSDPLRSKIVGQWEIEGTLMGDNGSGWVLPHKQSAPDCGKDHSIFSEDNTGQEVIYDDSCETKERRFTWQLQDSVLTLTNNQKTIKWHIKSIEDNTLKVGVQLRPDSDKRVYVAYKKVINK